MTRATVLAALVAGAVATGPAGAAAPPDVATLSALVAAGGGVGDFRTVTLVRTLAGRRAPADFAALTEHYGAAAVKRSVAMLDFVVGDAVARLRRAGYAIAAGDADLLDPRALAAELRAAGGAGPNAAYRVDTMVDSLVTRPIAVALARDLRARFGERSPADLARMVRTEMAALATAYGV